MSGTGIEKVADRVAEALIRAGFDKQFVNALLRSFEEQVEKTGL